MNYLWDGYQRLSNRRQNGMDVNPISFESIMLFGQLNQITFHAWEVHALERIDDAVLARWQEDNKLKSSSDSEGETQIPTSNPTGIKALMQGLKARQAAKKANG